MLKDTEMRYLINTARANYSTAIRAINNSKYYKAACNSCVRDYATVMLEGFLSVMNADSNEEAWKTFSELDATTSDNLINLLKDTFGFIGSEELLELSNIILSYQSDLSRTAGLLPPNALKGLDKDLQRLKELNTMLCDYAGKFEE